VGAKDKKKRSKSNSVKKEKVSKRFKRATKGVGLGQW
jgi:hypothetical protein